MTFKLAIITESECIGCTKCLQFCPFDAIIGANKQMHTVLETECTGCELCVAPCPVDCIKIIEIPEQLYDSEKIKIRRKQHRERLEKTFAQSPENTETKKQKLLQSLERSRSRL
ncbi:MAG TPA: RnfABCDGE type electron transport complex subunit B [Gammaproteobacteria bacterium]|nr:RnfABCDGE type electron transport complex subunit B [Gammaproteobacteria bacterium]